MKKKRREKVHEPVLVDEVIESLNLENFAHLNSQGIFIDATVGAGGHSAEIVKRGCFVLGIDADEKMLKITYDKLISACPIPVQHRDCFKLVHGNFINIAKIAKESGLDNVDGILFDLGTSTLQLTSTTRGMSFLDPSAPCDMRLDTVSQGVTGADLLNSLPESRLVQLFSVTSSKNFSKKLAKKIVEDRIVKKYDTTGDFLDTIGKFKSAKKAWESKLHPATLPFLALRIAVNYELENLKEALPNALRLLVKKGRLVVISFHSGEDKIVKSFFKQVTQQGRARIVNKKPITASKEEVENNPSARSAKLRALEAI